ncbi:hypothetical protein NA57DRAFT_52882 [Rhizodiscina lignyota]|uniref:Uncharacterized protein n=1 Tax=Rhizodiscina lignyota TaxID=1504668 RepID=A0A9P4IQ64_9PEZI|nr:hypothetical protein NA57DRAFT_52882 [Rhizodiscina lignyota]
MSHDLVGYTPEPNAGRGTVNILWTCLATVFLCTYTVLHLDVPSRSDKWHLIRRKIKWVAIGVLVPELIAWIAFDQWLYARRTWKLMRQYSWSTATMLDAHFLAMQGISVRTNSGTVQRTINKEMVEQFVKIEEYRKAFPPVELIRDKSKTDFLGKLMTCLQILWFLIQVLSRKLQGHDVSLIDVSNVSYVLLALLSFGFWAEKPNDISQPIEVDLPNSVDNFGQGWPSSWLRDHPHDSE